MPEHCADPWGLLTLLSGTPRVVDQYGESFAVAISEDRARRIVACVNACAGMSTAALESSVAAGWPIIGRIDEIARDGDQVALRRLVEKLRGDG